MDNRAGVFVMQPSGFKSFSPHDLPPEPPVEIDGEMLALLSEADRKLGRLDGVTQILPNPEMFVAMYVKKEAVLSSQIEGTQASLTDVLEVNAKDDKREDVGEVVNYVAAMNYGLKRLKEFPLCLRLIREIHEVLLSNGRGSNRNPGEFRKTQNWIGPAGCTLADARFVPPIIPDMEKALGNLENFFYTEDNIPALIKIALIHSQFESIHPFLDGNGRMGRLLITFWLCQQDILSQPLLYLSYYFKKNRLEYYDRLMAVREKGDWEGWIKFFLKGVAMTADEATTAAKEIIQLKSACENKIVSKGWSVVYNILLDYLFEFPIVSINDAVEKLQVSYPTSAKVIDNLCSLGVLQDITPDQKRNKKYAFVSYMEILNRGTELL
ncbi:MAG: Fic family protein [Faecalimonas sp.]|nr:Fic family protein [Faecalimonas sp.]